MKKLLVALLALALVGAASAADLKASATAPSIDLEATLSWGIDIDTMATGFKNEASLGLTFPLIDEVDVAGGGEGVYGEISIDDVSLEIADGVVGQAGAAGDISATLHLNALSFTVTSAPSLDVDMIAPTHDAGAIDFSAYTFGTTIGYDMAPATIGLSVLSMGDWTANAGNDYVAGVTLDLDLGDMLSVSVAGAYDVANADFQGGVSLPVSLAVMKGLTVTAGADFSSVGGTLTYAAGLENELQLTDANDDDEYTYFALNAYFCANNDVEAGIDFTEPTAGGYVDNLGFGVQFNVAEALAALAWDAAANVDYVLPIDDTSDVEATAEFTLDSAQAKTLMATVTYTNTVVTNTTLSLTYTSGDFLAATPVLGTVVAACTIAY